MFDGEIKELNSRTILLKGENVPNLLDRMKGTETTLISCINTIKEC